ncbi:MAG: sugar ABC transporter permease, partial [Chloroflexota bacterium]
MYYRRYVPYIFVMPMILGLILFRFGPIVASFAISFTRWRGTIAPQFIGWGNYRELIGSDVFWEVMLNTLLFAVFFVPATMILGLLLALLVNQKLPGIA